MKIIILIYFPLVLISAHFLTRVAVTVVVFRPRPRPPLPSHRFSTLYSHHVTSSIHKNSLR